MNGSVAYDLNRNYLEARYRLFGTGTEGTSNYLFYRLPDGTIVKNTDKITDANGKQPGEEGYEDTYDLITDANGKEPGDQGYITTYANQMYEVKYANDDYNLFDVDYVKRYVADGDFRFSDGKKPKKADMRLSTTEGYLPIYPTILTIVQRTVSIVHRLTSATEFTMRIVMLTVRVMVALSSMLVRYS